MSGKITKSAYVQLIKENIAWLKTMPRTLERNHIMLIVEKSIDFYYPTSHPHFESVQPHGKLGTGSLD
jgi:hypothetical protein